MGSTSVTSLLQKLLRPEKKHKQQDNSEINRRYSAPVPDWLDIIEANTTPENDLKLQEQKRKGRDRYSSHQNVTDAKKQKRPAANTKNLKRKSHSGVFQSWFCMSGNSDTLDRTALPARDNVYVSANKRGTSNAMKSSNDGPPVPVGILRKDGGKKSRDNKNRLSAPTLEGPSAKSQDSREKHDTRTETQNTEANTAKKELFPHVNYRCDGTLEKPYVFPAGLTFGPEGRKLQLRKTTSCQLLGKPVINPRFNEKLVKADVHRSSTEDIIMEYAYEEDDQNHHEFDVRKAFYLKYDSNLNHSDEHMKPRVTFREKDLKQGARNSDIRTDSSSHFHEHGTRWKPKGGAANAHNSNGINRSSKRQSRAERYKNRYSMPNKNQDFVYMGSLENVNMCNDIEKEGPISKSSFDISGNESSSRRDNKNRYPRDRYSMLPRNTDLVYMGSLENVNQVLQSGSQGEAIGFSLPSNNFELDSVAEPSTSKEKKLFEDKNDKSITLTAGAHIAYRELTKSEGFNQSADGSSPSQEFMRRSEPNLVLSPGLSVANSSCNEHAGSGQEEEDDQFDMSSLPCVITQSWTQDNPFSRHTGRVSYMPGNKKSLAPPPAIIDQSGSSNSDVILFGTNKSLFMPGNKPFSIPPPPCYTPPKEDIDFSQAHLRETTCHRGSQTDLTIEFENLNMEDRDISLKSANVKTIFSGISAKTGEGVGVREAVPQKNKTWNYDSFVQRDESVTVVWSPTLEPSRELLDISNVSRGSDEVFGNNKNYNTEATLTPRFTKVSAKKSPDLERNMIEKISPASYRGDHSNRSNAHTNSASSISKQLHFLNENVPADSRISKTSTPIDRRMPQPKLSVDTNINLPHDKPVALPRKMYNTIELSESSPLILELHKDAQQTSTHSSIPPIPKQRHSLTYSRSVSSAGDYGQELVWSEQAVPCDANRKFSSAKLARTQSCEPCSTLQRKQIIDSPGGSHNKPAENAYEDVNDEHFYEEIDSINQEHIYEECAEVSSERYNRHNMSHKNDTDGQTRSNNMLSTLKKINLDSSPGQHRRNKQWQGSSGIDRMLSHGLHYSGMAYSLDELASVDRKNRYSADDKHIGAENRICHDNSDDNSSIADDEMSLSNEEDMDEAVKQLSLRRCVSADNLLRSGSIIDRSMILAKRRKKRMRERRSRSHVFTERHDLIEFNKFINSNTNYDSTKPAPKIHYNKRRTTSEERLYKHKPNHTDSGHDSDIVSPCTSPDARRHLDQNTSLNYENASDDICVPCQGTLPKKPWEVRLRNIQYQRKSRSRENLLTLSPVVMLK